MQALLDFILGVASRIYYLFRDRWYDALDVIDNAWGWIETAAAQARITAQNFATSLVNSVWTFVDDLEERVYRWLDFLYERIDEVRALLPEWVNEAIDDVLDWIQASIANVIAYVQEKLADERGFIESVREDLTDLVSTGISDVRSEISEWRPLLSELADAFSGNALARLLDLADRMYEDLVDFLDDPATWIFEKLEDKFLPWLENLLADALEATQDEKSVP